MIPESLVSYLKQTYKPDAILLHGSRARRDNFDSSDYDLLLIGTFGEPVLPHSFEAYALDIAAISPDQKSYFSSKTPVWPLEVIYDGDKNYGESLYLNNRALFQEGPKRLTEQETEDRKNFFRRLFTKLVNRYEDYQCRMHYAADIHKRAVRYYFELSERWDQSLPVALKSIKQEHPILYSELENIFSGDAKKACITVFQILFNEKI